MFCLHCVASYSFASCVGEPVLPIMEQASPTTAGAFLVGWGWRAGGVSELPYISFVFAGDDSLGVSSNARIIGTAFCIRAIVVLALYSFYYFRVFLQVALPCKWGTRRKSKGMCAQCRHQKVPQFLVSIQCV